MSRIILCFLSVDIEGPKFKGIMLQARSKKDDKTYGNFTSFDNETFTQPGKCNRTLISVTSDEEMALTNLAWIPIPKDVGEILFV